ncbi:regulatory-associated protein of mTOR, partial [Lates japonicus]
MVTPSKNYTQYIPLSIYDLADGWGVHPLPHDWAPTLGIAHKSFGVAAINPSHPLAQMPLPPSMKNCIQLAACEASELLPMNPDLPADLFTSCLTTPIKIALRWFCMQKSAKLVPGVTLDLIEKIPGRLNDRRTPLGELNWIFTAITDTIAWNVLPRDLFQKLFRQDLLVASLFRNFLLAERIMRSYNCTPVSSPRLPPTYMHAMWQAWDLAVDICLSQLPTIIEEGTAFRIWQNFDPWRWCRSRQAPASSTPLLSDPIPEVRCAAVFALGTFVGNSAERTDHSTTIDHNVAMMLAQLINDGSPVVRK